MQGEGVAAYACAVDLTDFTDPDVTVEVVGSELTIRIGLPADANVDRLRAHVEPGRLAIDVPRKHLERRVVPVRPRFAINPEAEAV